MRTKQDTMPGGLRQERRACCGGISYGKIQPNHREEGIGRDEGNQSGGPGTGGRLPTGRMRWGERRSGAHPGRGLLSGGVRRTGGELDGLGGGGRVGTHAEQHTSGPLRPGV